jgi:formylglycine-generating enzyme required for sulfatase activity
MSGNVWEWCSDWWGVYPSDAQRNPTGPSSGTKRIVRGGGCNNVASNCRSAFHCGSDPAGGYRSITDRYGITDYIIGEGFRVVRGGPAR